MYDAFDGEHSAVRSVKAEFSLNGSKIVCENSFLPKFKKAQKDLAKELRKDGIDRVFTEQEKRIKDEFVDSTLTKAEKGRLKDNTVSREEKNRIRSNVNQKFYILREFLLDVVRQINF